MSNKLHPLAETSATVRAGLAIIHDTREIATAWLHYHQDVVRHASEASQALLRARTSNEILEVQAQLLRRTAQSFQNRITKMAETAGQMATRLYDAQEKTKIKDGVGAVA